MPDADTIVALATAAGPAAIGVVRVSGPLTKALMQGICGRELPAREACVARFRDANGATIDEGIALYFAGPHSYTAEDVLELQAHGGPVSLRLLITRCLELGARLAQPGEFTRRAFLNDKLDLAQAEAVADLISASTEQAARSAVRSLQGKFSALVGELQSKLTDVRVFVEAALDFPEEDIDPAHQARVPAQLRAVDQVLEEAIAAAHQGTLLREGLRVALVGAPNVGKSSIINVLSNEDVAIVTSMPGTTRDLIRQTVEIDGLPVHIIDTAGLRAAADPVEEIGIDRTWQAIATADLIVLVADARAPDHALSHDIAGKLPAGRRLIHVHNKIDLLDGCPGLRASERATEVRMSAKTGAGLSLLKQAIADSAGWSGAGEGLFLARARHVDALTRARAHLEAAIDLGYQGELVAEELRQAQSALSELTGGLTSEDLLGEIFSRFCIGK